MGSGVKQGLLIALPMYIHEEWLKFAQKRLSRQLVIDEDLVSTAGCKLAPDDDLAIVGAIDCDSRIAQRSSSSLLHPTEKQPLDDPRSRPALEDPM